MVEVASKTEEFCLLWIPHWSTCMTKAEWASWAQVFVSLVAIYAALRAVYAAHKLSMKAMDIEHRRSQATKQAESLQATQRLVDAEGQRVAKIRDALKPIDRELSDGRTLDYERYETLKMICRAFLATDYSSFEVVDLIESLIQSQRAMREALQGLGRIAEAERRAAKGRFFDERASVAFALNCLDDTLHSIANWQGKATAETT